MRNAASREACFVPPAAPQICRRAAYPEHMPREMRLTALDSALTVTFTDSAPDELVNTAARAWSRCRTTAPAGTTAEPLTVTAPPDPSLPGINAALQHLTREVTRRFIAAQTGRLLMFHAGAVSHPDTGASLVFVAPGGTGKTTLARTLAARYGYLTDETVGVAPSNGRIHPYPKPLSLREGGPHKREASPDELGLGQAHPQPTVGRLVLLRRPAHHTGAPAVEELGLLDAVAALIPETSALHKLPRPLQRAEELIERTGPVLRLSYREAADLAPLVAEIIGEAP